MCGLAGCVCGLASWGVCVDQLEWVCGLAGVYVWTSWGVRVDQLGCVCGLAGVCVCTSWGACVDQLGWGVWISWWV